MKNSVFICILASLFLASGLIQAGPIYHQGVYNDHQDGYNHHQDQDQDQDQLTPDNGRYYEILPIYPWADAQLEVINKTIGVDSRPTMIALSYSIGGGETKYSELVFNDPDDNKRVIKFPKSQIGTELTDLTVYLHTEKSDCSNTYGNDGTLGCPGFKLSGRDTLTVISTDAINFKCEVLLKGDDIAKKPIPPPYPL